MSCNLIDRIKEFVPTKTSSIILSLSPPTSGILDVHCGCMVSKWNSVEFKKIFGLDKDYLQINIIYIEPFNSFDSVSLHFDWDDVPCNILNAYEKSKTYTTFDEVDGMITMIVPYIYKNSRTTLKRFHANSWLIGDVEDLHGIYVSNENDINKINNMFQF